MNRFIIIVAVILIIGHLLTEAYPFLPAAWREKQLDIFIKPGFHMPLNFSWYMKFMADDLLTIGVFYIMTQMAKLINRTLFYISSIFLVYHVVDAMLFIWNFKRSTEIYWVLLSCSIIAIFILLRPRPLKIIRA